ncbi:TonB-dependent receptor family protein [Rhodanobacter sp. Col0626]|uniref:TonB-dependent receptor family protein n=1 Tax=Rhodanobacter sp. Col0626 TaxID=3415679 RepID=UPI003CF05742
MPILPAMANGTPTTTMPKPTVLPAVVVTATRSAQQPFDLPLSIDAVDLQRVQADRVSINPSESLREVPGVLARDRQNAAQDEQVSIRGFGARTTFGVRGVRLYVDGIPATMPDGQGQLSNFSLGAADRIEVLRGPFSALYGNSSGGVIQLFTADGTDPPEWRMMFGAGRYAGQRVELGTRGIAGNLDYNLDLSRLSGDGFRRHSRSERDNGNARLRFTLGDGSRITVVANSVLLPHAQDPKGLTHQEYLADPRQAAPSALLYDTRKSVRQNQAGLIVEHDDDHGGQWRALAYYGERTVQQFLSIPPSAQTSPLSAGGVVDLDGDYGGTDLRRRWDGQLGGRPFELVVGSSWDQQNQQRRGYENFVGETLGVIGALRRNERNVVWDFDQYAQASWRLSPRWSLSGGVRRNSVHFGVDDRYITAGNPDDSGHRVYAATTPVAGLLFRAGRDWHLYASWGRGFETPTFNELGYRSDGGSGLNLGLQAARTDNLELGSKWRWAGDNSVELAWFQADTRNELAVDSNTDGRTTYRNRGRARRRGVETELQLSLAPRWQAHVAYTWLDARFSQPLDGSAGTRIAGVPRSALDASLRWGASHGWHAQLQLSAIGAVVADDANTARAPGYALVDASVGYVIDDAGMQIAPFLRLDNLFDRRYIGSVIVNESTGRYFEPGPGRAVYVGCRLTFR